MAGRTTRIALCCAWAYLLLGYSPSSTLAAEFRFAHIFGDHLVLQRDRPIVVWGWSEPGDSVRVTLEEQERVTEVNESGSWRVTFDPRAASFQELTLQAESKQTHEHVMVHDVVVGEVWHASGQSNMEMTVASVLARLPSVAESLKAGDHAGLRFCRLDAPAAEHEATDLRRPVDWTVGSSESVRNVSAVAYFFARRLQERLQMPIGIVDSSRGGTPIEPFIPRSAFRGHATLVRELELGDAGDLQGLTQLPGGVRARDENWLPGRLFHSRIAPIGLFAVRGVIWYQGESNCGDGEDPRYYEHKMRALVRGWRETFANDQLPFYYVQLPGSGAREGWPYLREQQRRALDLPHTGMAVTLDLLDADIHPPNKIDVGERLARWALHHDYQQPIVFSGPFVREARLQEEQVQVLFEHVGSGLMVATKNGLEAPQELAGERELRLFELADERGQWWGAQARIEGDTVIVRSQTVRQPTAVRYAYGVSPQPVQLYNREGLPASPFEMVVSR